MTIAELPFDDFPRVLPLYRSLNVCFPLISAVIQKRQRGQVFVNDSDDPQSALVVNNFGFMSYVGRSDNYTFNEGLTQLLATGHPLKRNYLLWYSPPERWKTALDQRGSGVVRCRKRTRFELETNAVDYSDVESECPSGFQLQTLVPSLFPQTSRFGLNIDSRFWSSCDDFFENGFGVCLMKDQNMVSLCYSAAIVDGLAEIDVVTDPEFRAQGFAVIVTQAFIRECAKRNVIATWDCFVDNVGSMKLAKRVGFREKNTYDFYSFNIPIEISFT